MMSRRFVVVVGGYVIKRIYEKLLKKLPLKWLSPNYLYFCPRLNRSTSPHYPKRHYFTNTKYDLEIITDYLQYNDHIEHCHPISIKSYLYYVTENNIVNKCAHHLTRCCMYPIQNFHYH